MADGGYNMTKLVYNVLDSIFNSDTGFDEIERNALKESPSYSDVFSFADLLSKKPNEEKIQKFILEHPKFLTALEGYADSKVLAVIPKPKIGQFFCADYGILAYDQGGCIINLIELEPSNEGIFNKNLTPAKRYRGAITQISDWDEWIQSNKSTFINDIITIAKKMKLSSKNIKSGFRTVSPETLKRTWDAYGGSNPQFQFTIVIGRWSQLKENARIRLISLNKKNWFKTFTYEQMIRRGIERPFGKW